MSKEKRVKIIDVRLKFDIDNLTKMDEELLQKLQGVLDREKQRNTEDIKEDVEEIIEEVRQIEEDIVAEINNGEDIQEKLEDTQEEPEDTQEELEIDMDKILEDTQEEPENIQEEPEDIKEELEDIKEIHELDKEINQIVDENYVEDPIDVIVKLLIEVKSITRDDLRDKFNGASGSKLSAIVTKINKKLSDSGLELKRFGKKNVVYKLIKKG